MSMKKATKNNETEDPDHLSIRKTHKDQLSPMKFVKNPWARYRRPVASPPLRALLAFLLAAYPSGGGII
jgi:hypothetical protein